MARLDRLGTAREVAQLGATLGREFPYEMLQAISLLEEATLQHELAQLVAAGLLYQRGVPPQARYVFKHVLIHDVAYATLPKAKRRERHAAVARFLEETTADRGEMAAGLARHSFKRSRTRCSRRNIRRSSPTTRIST